MDTEETATYQGWKNYCTWCVKLWIENEESSYRYWGETAQEVWSKRLREATDTCTPESNSVIARGDLAERLKDEITDAAPDLGASLYSDILNAGLGEVDWYEIANSLLEDQELEGYEGVQ